MDPEHAGYLSGWLPAVTIHELVQEHRTLFQSAPFVLVSMLDSSEEISTIVDRLDPARVVERVSDNPFVTSGAAFAQLATEYRLLTGFDEIWVCREPPPAAPPVEASLVGPEQLTAGAPGVVTSWMEASSCVLGLGDGTGLNYVATDAELATELGLVGPSGQRRDSGA